MTGVPAAVSFAASHIAIVSSVVETVELMA
jgi:hypothetical protein